MGTAQRPPECGLQEWETARRKDACSSEDSCGKVAPDVSPRTRKKAHARVCMLSARNQGHRLPPNGQLWRRVATRGHCPDAGQPVQGDCGRRTRGIRRKHPFCCNRVLPPWRIKALNNIWRTSNVPGKIDFVQQGVSACRNPQRNSKDAGGQRGPGAGIAALYARSYCKTSGSQKNARTGCGDPL